MTLQQLHICIDSNEASKQHSIITYLKFNGFNVDVKPLDVCDYVVSDRVGVERKDATDFLSSMKDGRLFSQAKDMVQVYEKPVIILEGHMKKALKRSKMRSSSVYGAMSSLALEYGVNIIPSDDPESTAVLLHRLCYREQAKEMHTIQLRSINRSLPLHQQQVYLLSGLPQIGTTLAEELLNTFETPYQVLVKFAEAEVYTSATGKTKRLLGPLSEVKGVGPKIVESAQQLLNESYPHLCGVVKD
jgi:ERCC4-type nuclease